MTFSKSSILVSAFFCFQLQGHLVQISLETSEAQKTYFKTETPHVFFDFHNVLVVKDKQTITKAAKKH